MVDGVIGLSGHFAPNLAILDYVLEIDPVQTLSLLSMAEIALGTKFRLKPARPILAQV